MFVSLKSPINQIVPEVISPYSGRFEVDFIALPAVLPASTKILVMEPNRPVAGRRHTHAYTLPQRMEWGAKKIR